MSTIVHRFSKNTRKNDSLVKRFIEKHFPICLPKYRTDVNKQRAQNQNFKSAPHEPDLLHSHFKKIELEPAIT